MSKCVNPNDPEVKKLIERFGKAKAILLINKYWEKVGGTNSLPTEEFIISHIEDLFLNDYENAEIQSITEDEDVTDEGVEEADSKEKKTESVDTIISKKIEAYNKVKDNLGYKSKKYETVSQILNGKDEFPNDEKLLRRGQVGSLLHDVISHALKSDGEIHSAIQNKTKRIASQYPLIKIKSIKQIADALTPTLSSLKERYEILDSEKEISAQSKSEDGEIRGRFDLFLIDKKTGKGIILDIKTTSNPLGLLQEAVSAKKDVGADTAIDIDTDTDVDIKILTSFDKVALQTSFYKEAINEKSPGLVDDTAYVAIGTTINDKEGVLDNIYIPKGKKTEGGIHIIQKRAKFINDTKELFGLGNDTEGRVENKILKMNHSVKRLLKDMKINPATRSVATGVNLSTEIKGTLNGISSFLNNVNYVLEDNNAIVGNFSVLKETCDDVDGWVDLLNIKSNKDEIKKYAKDVLKVNPETYIAEYTDLLDNIKEAVTRVNKKVKDVVASRLHEIMEPLKIFIREGHIRAEAQMKLGIKKGNEFVKSDKAKNQIDAEFKDIIECGVYNERIYGAMQGLCTLISKTRAFQKITAMNALPDPIEAMVVYKVYQAARKVREFRGDFQKTMAQMGRKIKNFSAALCKGPDGDLEVVWEQMVSHALKDKQEFIRKKTEGLTPETVAYETAAAKAAEEWDKENVIIRELDPNLLRKEFKTIIKDCILDKPVINKILKEEVLGDTLDKCSNISDLLDRCATVLGDNSLEYALVKASLGNIAKEQKAFKPKWDNPEYKKIMARKDTDPLKRFLLDHWYPQIKKHDRYVPEGLKIGHGPGKVRNKGFKIDTSGLTTEERFIGVERPDYDLDVPLFYSGERSQDNQSYDLAYNLGNIVPQLHKYQTLSPVFNEIEIIQSYGFKRKKGKKYKKLDLEIALGYASKVAGAGRYSQPVIGKAITGFNKFQAFDRYFLSIFKNTNIATQTAIGLFSYTFVPNGNYNTAIASKVAIGEFPNALFEFFAKGVSTKLVPKQVRVAMEMLGVTSEKSPLQKQAWTKIAGDIGFLILNMLDYWGNRSISKTLAQSTKLYHKDGKKYGTLWKAFGEEDPVSALENLYTDKKGQENFNLKKSRALAMHASEIQVGITDEVQQYFWADSLGARAVTHNKNFFVRLLTKLFGPPRVNYETEEIDTGLWTGTSQSVIKFIWFAFNKLLDYLNKIFNFKTLEARNKHIPKWQINAFCTYICVQLGQLAGGWMLFYGPAGWVRRNYFPPEPVNPANLPDPEYMTDPMNRKELCKWKYIKGLDMDDGVATITDVMTGGRFFGPGVATVKRVWKIGDAAWNLYKYNHFNLEAEERAKLNPFHEDGPYMGYSKLFMAAMHAQEGIKDIWDILHPKQALQGEIMKTKVWKDNNPVEK